MRKIILAILILTMCNTSCKKEREVSLETSKEDLVFNQLLTDYNKGKLALKPLDPTFAGDNRFNDQFPNTLSDEFSLKTKDFYTNYKK